MTTIVYPYLAGKNLWKEIIYSIRSVEKHFKGPFEICIVGDMPDGIDPSKVLHIPHKKNYNLPNPRYMDAQLKLIAAMNSLKVSEDFICMYDDVYLNTDVDLHFFQKQIFGQRKAEYFKVQDIPGSGSLEWKGLLLKSFELLRKEKVKGYDFETHLPRWVNKRYLQKAVDIFHLHRVPCQRWTVYYSYFLSREQKPVIYFREHESIKAGYYGVESPSMPIENYMFINHNDSGLSKPLKNKIKELFPNKSNFEL